MMKNLRSITHQFEYYLLWFAVTGISWSVSMIVAIIIGEWLSALMPLTASLAIGLVSGGMLTGLVQQELLRPVVKGKIAWILATTIGWAIGLGIMALTMRATGTLIISLFVAALGGLSLGFAQWLSMASEDRRRGHWVVANIVGWSAAMYLGAALAGNTAANFVTTDLATIVVIWTLGWSIVAMVSLIALPTLFPRVEKRESDARIRWW